MRRLACAVTFLVLAGCAAKTTAGAGITPAPPTTSVAVASAAAHPAAPIDAQDALLGPGGMTLRQEVGAVMMVGFSGPPTSSVLSDWRLHQFGGLIVVSGNRNTSGPDATRQLISSVRAVMAHPLLAATVPAAGTMPESLKALGFDISIARASSAQAVTSAVAGIHAAGVYAAIEVTGDDDLPILHAVIAAHADLVMAGQLVARGTSVSGGAVAALRSQLGAQQLVISNDLESDATGITDPVPVAAVRFLENGGDMVIVAHHLNLADATYDAIHAAVVSGAYPRAELDASVQKLLNLGLRFMP